MLNKKQWLRLLSELLSKNGRLDNFTVRRLVQDSGKYWKRELSPGEVFDRYLHFEEGLTDMQEWYDVTPPNDYLNPNPRPQFV